MTIISDTKEGTTSRAVSQVESKGFVVNHWIWELKEKEETAKVLESLSLDCCVEVIPQTRGRQYKEQS